MRKLANPVAIPLHVDRLCDISHLRLTADKISQRGALRMPVVRKTSVSSVPSTLTPAPIVSAATDRDELDPAAAGTSTDTNELAASDGLIHVLRERGQRLTWQRTAVITAVGLRVGSFTVEELYECVARQHPSIDISTVYRTFQMLHALGLIAKVDTRNGPRRYALSPYGDRHHRLVCDVCGRTVIIPAEALATLALRLRRSYAFLLNERVVLPGVCGACVQRA